ncbi:hypothetical protein EDD65_10441 [Keratinibaculum paraultunense]|uniref:Uncharacterized protein n=1 Tax=Keratinibaculum paraultunense TaxID=1278232 RepID=A0A4R3L0N9_9FIRM|nr:hypothetical protein [Keratinibaculum paraultunense]QQY78888.1 hypothetical protein JL105_06715 [Keratinibaculum paraultunense]TCS90500.1 hypothetical protein EDD65_10441 [Keratinibaculum paraultunense]
MLDEVFEKYIGNFKYFILFFILSIILAFVIKDSNVVTLILDNIGISDSLEEVLNIKNAIIFLIFILLETYIGTYGFVLAKKVIRNESIDIGNLFINTFSFYFRILGLNLLYILIILVLSFLIRHFVLSTTNFEFMIFNLILYLIAMIFLSMLTNIAQNFLVYNDDNIINSIKGGFKIGKKHVFKLLGLLIVASLVGQLPNMEAAETNRIVFGLGVFIISLYQAFMNLYIANLCKAEK